MTAGARLCNLLDRLSPDELEQLAREMLAEAKRRKYAQLREMGVEEWT